MTLLDAWSNPAALPRWRRQRRQRRLGYALGACGALTLLLYVALELGVDLFGTVHVAGVTLQRKRGATSALTAYAERWQNTVLTMHAGPYLVRYPRVSLGAQLPVATAHAAVLALGRSGNPVRDFSDLWVSWRSFVVVPWRVEWTPQVLATRVRELRNKLERSPVPGVWLPDGRELPGTPGLTINLLGSMDRVARALATSATDVSLDVVSVPAPRSSRYDADPLDPRQFAETLAEFVTRYRTQGPAAGRARNIELAAQALDGVVIAPGSVLSFNDKVGQRSYERGFEPAFELANRRVVRGVGGGVCQVAGTLHAAAFLAGFALPEYRPHSRPVRYIELGLDTMVSWPKQDLRIANVYPFGVRIGAQAAGGVLRVRLEGAGKAHPVEWSTQVLQRVSGGVRRLRAAGETRVVQEAVDGVLVKRTRVVYGPEGERREERLLRYPAVDRIELSADGEAGGGGAEVVAVEDF